MMNKLGVAILSLSLMGAGCAVQVPAATKSAPVMMAGAKIMDSGLKGDRTVSVQLQDPMASGYSAQSIVHKWVKNDIFQYVVTLKIYNAATGNYDDFSPALSVVVPQKGGNFDRAVFTGLSQGAKYRTCVVAQGNNGGTAADIVLNSHTSAYVDYDFTATQDVEDTLSGAAKIIFDTVAFNGSATTIIQGPDDGTFSNPTERPGAAAAHAPIALTTHVNYNAWGWDIVSTGVTNLDMSPILCSDGQLHTPNSFVAVPLDGTLNPATIHASYPNWFDANTASGNYQWWMYAGQWAQYGVHTVGVKSSFNDGQGVTGLSAIQATASF